MPLLAYDWNVYPKGGRKVDLVVQLGYQDGAYLFGHGKFAQFLTLSHPLPVIPDGFAFILEIEAQQFLGVI